MNCPGSAGVSPVPACACRAPTIPAGLARRRPSGAHPSVHTGTGETPALPVIPANFSRTLPASQSAG